MECPAELLKSQPVDHQEKRNTRGYSVWDIVPPRSLKENVEYRIAIRKWAAKKRGNRLALMERCRKDFVFWVETFCWIFEPRPEAGRPQVMPFIMWDCQIPVALTIIENLGHRDIGLEKARGEGATWICLMIILWRWLFAPDMESYGLVSRSEEVADSSEDPDSLGWKLDWQLKQLPLWMAGVKTVPGGQPKDFTRNITKHTWTNHRNQCTISAYAATGNLASGGRKTAFLMDELAKFPRGPDEEAMSSTEPVTNCRILVSTPAGAEGAYYRVMTEPHTKDEFVHITLDWTKNQTRNRGMFRIDLKDRILIPHDPVANPIPESYEKKFFDVQLQILARRGFAVDDRSKLWSPWYVSRCLRPRMTPRKVAQEYDRDYGGSSSRFFPSVTIEALVEKSRLPLWQGDILVDRERHIISQFTKMREGKLKLWVSLGVGNKPPKGEYVVGADIATGLGGTMSSCSTLSIADRSTGTKVGEYASPVIRPEDFASLAIAVCRLFKSQNDGEAFLIWEGNGPGGAFRQHIIDETSFRNFYFRQNIKRMGKNTTKEPGWWSGKETKRELMSKYRHALVEGLFDNPSEYALRECLCYIEDTGGKVVFVTGLNDENDPANSGENHGDRVIADALANFGMQILNGGLEVRPVEKSSGQLGPPDGSFAWRRKQWEAANKKDLRRWI